MTKKTRLIFTLFASCIFIAPLASCDSTGISTKATTSSNDSTEITTSSNESTETTTSSNVSTETTTADKDSYTIVWKNYDGVILETDNLVAKGEMPEYNGLTPQKPSEGNFVYAFVGWDKEITPAKEDIVYTAVYEEKDYTKYSITYDLAPKEGEGGSLGGKNNLNNPTSYDKYMDNISLLAPTRNGYTFKGWEYEGNIITEIDTSIAAPIHLVAKWEVLDELSNFKFTWDDEKIEITGLLDETVSAIVVPDYVTDIKEGAFSRTANLESITLPFIGDKRHNSQDKEQYPLGYIFGKDSYTGGKEVAQHSLYISARKETYYIPSKLKDIIITDSEFIPFSAFRNCSDVKSITLPKNVKTIGAFAFDAALITYAFYDGNLDDWCSIEFETPSSNPLCFTSGLYLSDEEGLMVNNNKKYSKLYDAVFSLNVTEIKDYAFYGYTYLTTITIPNTVTKIGEYAFSKCSRLENVTIPNSVKEIKKNAFYHCSNLKSVELSNSLTSIEECVFSGCTGLENITIPNSVTSIEDNAFEFCTNIEGLTLPNSITSIGSYAFSGCYGLVNIELPGSVLSIGDGAFYRCINLEGVTLQRGTITIGKFAFESCSKLANITLPVTLTSIGNKAFQECSTLNSIVIPNSVTNIGEHAFESCSNLATVTLSNSVTNIGDYAFKSCSNLSSISLPNTMKSIGKYVFANCTSLNSVSIPNTVISIGEGAFCECRNLEGITLPNSITVIGNRAFYSCASLKNITIPDSVTSIGNEAFSSCGNLESVTLSNNITSICARTFSYSNRLSSITIPNGVTSIEDNAFNGCLALATINFDGTMSEWDNIILGLNWMKEVPATEVKCSDGNITL